MQPDENGMVRDFYTGKQIRYADAEKGHMLYYEHRYLDKAAEKMNMSPKDFRRMNKCSDILVPQDRTNNRGHDFESHENTVGFNTCLSLISRFLKYSKPAKEQEAIDKQVQKARLDYLREMRDRGRFDRDKNESKKINTRTESLLTAENRLNYNKMDAYIARDKAREAKKSGNKDSPAKSIPVRSDGISGKAGGRSAGSTGGRGTGSTGGRGTGSTGGRSAGSTGGRSAGSTGGKGGH